MIHPHRGPHLIRYGVRVITPPVREPFDADEARAHLRVALTDENDWIASNISVAREYCEFYLARAIAPQTLELTTNAFPTAAYFRHPAYEYFGDLTIQGGMLLPMNPVTEIVSVKYYDKAGLIQTMDPSDYFLDNVAEPTILYPAMNKSWPETWHIMSAVQIRYNAGYDLPDEPNDTNPNPLPASIKAAMMLILGHLHENRENTLDIKLVEMPTGAKSLMDRYRLRLGFA